MYWLMKSEPGCYSIDDLAKDKTTFWDGVRNYQARNFMRDEMKKGDLAFFYHSNAKDETGIAGIAKVIKEGYPDNTAWDPEDDHFDPKASPENPRWYRVDIQLVKKFKHPITLKQLKQNPKLASMRLLQKGNRLSVMPVDEKDWNEVLKMADA